MDVHNSNSTSLASQRAGLTKALKLDRPPRRRARRSHSLISLLSSLWMECRGIRVGYCCRSPVKKQARPQAQFQKNRSTWFNRNWTNLLRHTFASWIQKATPNSRTPTRSRVISQCSTPHWTRSSAVVTNLDRDKICGMIHQPNSFPRSRGCSTIHSCPASKSLSENLSCWSTQSLIRTTKSRRCSENPRVR